MEVAGIEDTIAGVWALYRNENLDGYLKECGKRLAGTVEVLSLKYKYVSLSLFSIFSIYQNTGVYIYIFHAYRALTEIKNIHVIFFFIRIGIFKLILLKTNIGNREILIS